MFAYLSNRNELNLEKFEVLVGKSLRFVDLTACRRFISFHCSLDLISFCNTNIISLIRSFVPEFFGILENVSETLKSLTLINCSKPFCENDLLPLRVPSQSLQYFVITLTPTPTRTRPEPNLTFPLPLP
jgi:hypothetical protein